MNVSQSSTDAVNANDYSAGKAIDGSTIGIDIWNTVAQTNRQVNPWWTVYFTSASVVDKVYVWKSLNVNYTQTGDFSDVLVELLNVGAQEITGEGIVRRTQVTGTAETILGGVLLSGSLGSLNIADFGGVAGVNAVRVSLSGTKRLALAEVKVFPPVSTDAPSAKPSLEPSVSPPSPAGCCSQNFKNCDALWCGSTKEECESCGNGNAWLENGQVATSCLARWGDCTNDVNACCSPAVCVQVNDYYSQCLSPLTDAPTSSPSVSHEPSDQPSFFVPRVIISSYAFSRGDVVDVQIQSMKLQWNSWLGVYPVDTDTSVALSKGSSPWTYGMYGQRNSQTAWIRCSYKLFVANAFLYGLPIPTFHEIKLFSMWIKNVRS